MNINEFRKAVENVREIVLYRKRLIYKRISKATVSGDIYILQGLDGQLAAYDYVLHILKEVSNDNNK